MKFMRLLLVVTAGFAASVASANDSTASAQESTSAASDAWTFVCDGTDFELLADVDEAFRSRVGYGETWDESICDEGLLSVYSEGVNSRWPAYRRLQKPKAPAVPMVAKPQPAPIGPDFAKGEKRLNDQFFALFMPVFAAAACGFALLVAAVIGLFLRLRKTIVVDVACPACQMAIPFVVGESLQLFCPGCGDPCRVDLHVSKQITRATAVSL